MKNVILLVGAARSGTSWLAKIFDSHPDVVYRHEPDIPDRGIFPVPALCNDDEVERLVDVARRRLHAYVETRHVRAAGSYPLFRKHYLTRFQYGLRKGMVYAYRSVERLRLLGSLIYCLPVPDFTDLDGGVTIAIKSVNALGHLNLMTAAAKTMPIVMIVRHPCGYVGSRLRLRSSTTRTIGDGLPKVAQAKRRGLTREKIVRMSPIEQLAWVWTIFNEKAMDELEGRANTRIVRYEDLCADPVAVARDLFAFAGLSWEGQTEAFLAESTSSRKPSGDPFSIYRDTKAEIDKWRRQMPAEQIEQIMAIVADSRPGRLYS